MNFCESGGVNDRMSPDAIFTTRVLPSTYWTVPLSVWVLAVELLWIFSVVVFGICFCANSRPPIVSARHEPLRTLPVVIVIFLLLAFASCVAELSSILACLPGRMHYITAGRIPDEIKRITGDQRQRIRLSRSKYSDIVGGNDFDLIDFVPADLSK